MRPLVVTTCSAKKRAAPVLSANQLAQGRQCDVERAWLQRLQASAPVMRADRLYAGRGFGMAAQAAAALGADLAVISAGLGYVAGAKEVPSYDLTVSGRHANALRDRVTERFDPVHWWRSVSASPYSTSLCDDLAGRPLVVICLSAEYARLVAADLTALAKDETVRANTRIFGLSIAKHLPKEWDGSVMSYDERFNSLGVTGTRVDFAQRAALDFITHFDAKALTVSDARDFVVARMQGGRRAGEVQRKRLTDEEVLEAIADAAPEIGTKASPLLRHLRHTSGLACEQARFRRLLDRFLRVGQ